MTVVETSGLTKRFGDVTAVDDLDLSVEAGEVFGFLGPNGAGKLTTINALLGFLHPTSGRVSVLGHDPTTEATRVRQRVGLLPEGFSALPNLSAREHVRSAIQTKGADDDPDAVLDRVGLDPDDRVRPAGEYSSGMAQRLALAVALVGDPDLLILDEPSSGLDPNGVKLLREIVREERDRGATVFFSSHVLDEVERVCDRVGILRAGTLTAVNDVETLRADLDAGATVEATVDATALEGASAGDPAAASGRGRDALQDIVEECGVRDVDGVTDVSVDGGVVRVECARPRAKMQSLRAVDDAVPVLDVRIEEASLESVFEVYTGDGVDGPHATPGSPGEAAADPGDADPAVAASGGDRA